MKKTLAPVSVGVNRIGMPYPMVFDPDRRDLKRFQRWAVRGLYRSIPFSDYRPGAKAAHHPNAGQGELALVAANCADLAVAREAAE